VIDGVFVRGNRGYAGGGLPENGRHPRQRATQILKNVVSVGQCTSGVGYAYDERNFTVCVEDVS
jgi:hypothetical protein